MSIYTLKRKNEIKFLEKLTRKSRNDFEDYNEAYAIRETFWQDVNRVHAISSSTENYTSEYVLLELGPSGMEISPIPFTKFVFVGLQVYSHHSFFKFTPQSGTFCPKTVSICLKELVMIAT